MIYNGHVIIESAIIAQLLADSVSSTHLIPRTGEVQGALVRAKIAFFVETYFSGANIYYYRAIEAKTDEEAEDLGKRYSDAVVTDVEPLLRDAKPFFNGSSKLTMAEVSTLSPHRCWLGFYYQAFTSGVTETIAGPDSLIYHSNFHTALHRRCTPAKIHDSGFRRKGTKFLRVGSGRHEASVCK
jgi:hypothetical protein